MKSTNDAPNATSQLSSNRLMVVPGKKFAWKGVGYYVTKILENNVAETRNLMTQRIVEMTYESILIEWTEGRLEFEVVGKPAKSPSYEDTLVTEYKVLDFNELSESQKKIALQMKEFITTLAKMPPSERTAEFLQKYSDEIFEKLIKDLPVEEVERLWAIRQNHGKNMPSEFAVSPRTLRRKLHEYLKSNFSNRSFVIDDSNRGAPGISRLDDMKNKLMDEVIQMHYLTRQQKTPAMVYEYLETKVDEHNKEMVKLGFLTLVISKTPSKSTFYRRINELDPYDTMVARQGVNAADRKFVITGRGIVVKTAMERVQIDYTTMNFILVDDVSRIPIGRPKMCRTVDQKTKIHPGYYFGFDENYGGEAECIYNSIMPSLDMRQKYGTVHELKGFGLFSTLVLDNGSALKNSHLLDAMFQLDITLEPCKKNAPRQKPDVERSFLSDYNDYIKDIPGTTFMNIFDRRDYDSKKYAVMSYSAFLKACAIYECDIYPFTPNRGLGGKCPAEVWDEEMEKGHWPTLPANLDELKILLGYTETRTLEHYGVDFETLVFQSTVPEVFNLRKWLLQQDPGSKPKVKIKIDSSNLKNIWLFDHLETKRYIPLEMTYPEQPEYTDGLSLWAHRSIVKFRNAVNREKSEQTKISLMEAKNRLREIVEAEFETTTQVRKRTRGQRFLSQSAQGSSPSQSSQVGQADQTNQTGQAEPADKTQPEPHPYSGMAIPTQLNPIQEDPTPGVHTYQSSTPEVEEDLPVIVPKTNIDKSKWSADLGPEP